MTEITVPNHMGAGGRPTTYKPEYCSMVVEWGKLGKSKAWICASLECTDQTLRNWQEAHPEFLEAMAISQKYSQMWWEDAGQIGMQGKSIDGSIWSRSMAARFPNDWREKQEHALTGASGGPVETITTVRLVGPND